MVGEMGGAKRICKGTTIPIKGDMRLETYVTVNIMYIVSGTSAVIQRTMFTPIESVNFHPCIVRALSIAEGSILTDGQQPQASGIASMPQEVQMQEPES